MHRGTFVLMAVVAGILSGPAPADISWDSTTARVEVAMTETTAKFSFSFANTGPAPIKVVDIRPSCSCVAVADGKEEYKSGERGAISGTVDIGSSTGALRRTILVLTNASDKPGTELSIIVAIPPPLTIEPRVIDLSKLSDGETTVISAVPATTATDVVIKSVDASDPALSVRLQPASDGASKLYISRMTMKGPKQASIRLQVELERGQVKRAITIPVLLRD